MQLTDYNIYRIGIETPIYPPIVFVHGAWHGAWCWNEFFMPYFASLGYPTYAIDLRGHGNTRSDKPVPLLRIHDYVEDLQCIAASLPTEPIWIAHSMGGYVVLKYLESHTAPAAVLLAPNPIHGVMFAGLRVVRMSVAPLVLGFLTGRSLEFFQSPRYAQKVFVSSRVPPETFQRYYAQVGDEAFLTILDLFGVVRLRPRRNQTPLYFLSGSEDALFAPWEIRRTAQAYQAPYQRVDGTGHDMMLDADWQLVADMIHGWLESRLNPLL